MAAVVRSGQVQLTDTIFAVSSGRPPAAIAVIRISGPQAESAVQTLAGRLPPPRRAGLRTLRHEGGVLDTALVLRFPGPSSATGEDLVELHCHGGRAVVTAVQGALAAIRGLRLAEPGEFTRRALSNGRIDLLEAEGLADLLEAETETQRIAALAATEGRLSGCVRGWLDTIAGLSAEVEAVLDYADEDDVADDLAALVRVQAGMMALRTGMERALEAPSVERLKAGVRVVIAGPPNAGKSTLLNLLAEREAAIVSPIAGTTRDRVEASVMRGGLPMTLVDTAGLTETDDAVEAIGVARAREAMGQADLLLWMGDEEPPVADAVWVHARCDLAGRTAMPSRCDIAISAGDPTSIDRLWSLVAERAAIPMAISGDMLPLHDHQRRLCLAAMAAFQDVSNDSLLVAEALASARRTLARLIGLDAGELMLDALFGRFCLGK